MLLRLTAASMSFLKINRVGVGRAPLKSGGSTGLFLFAGFNNRLDEFHVVDVESAERVFTFASALANRSLVCVSGIVFRFNHELGGPEAVLAYKLPPGGNEKCRPILAGFPQELTRHPPAPCGCIQRGGRLRSRHSQYRAIHTLIS